MNLDDRQAQLFLGPLRGKTTTFIVQDRQANLAFLREVAVLVSTNGHSSTVLDADGLYSSNADRILFGLSPTVQKSIRVIVPEPGAEIETGLSALFRTDSNVIVIETLNTIHHLLSASDVGSRGRKLAFIVASLSFLARTNFKACFLIMYLREKVVRTTGGSISGLSDVTINVESSGSNLRMRRVQGTVWPEERFSVCFT